MTARQVGRCKHCAVYPGFLYLGDVLLNILTELVNSIKVAESAQEGYVEVGFDPVDEAADAEE
jgi:hypothetical protein